MPRRPFHARGGKSAAGGQGDVAQEAGLSSHILPNAANLVGVSFMALSLVKMLPRAGWSDGVDELLASAGLVFLVSVVLSYASLRRRRCSARLENWAERLFLLGLGIIILASAILAFDLG
ncbi:MAG: hypothetical protein AB1831_01670 [Pseudomonadota bacterium]